MNTQPKILTLTTTRQCLDEILSGRKTHECRSVTPRNIHKMVFLSHQGKDYPPDAQDIPHDGRPVRLGATHYDAIKFLAGRNAGRRPWLMVAVKQATPIVMEENDGGDLIFEYAGEDYIFIQIDYALGRVLRTSP